MKTFLKISAYFISIIFIIFLIGIIAFYSLTSKTKIDENKLINTNVKIKYYDENNQVFLEESNGKKVVNISEINDNTKNAFIAIEDRRFYKHNGVDFKSLNRAFFNNVKSFSFKEGASTITQQLVKNTHLSSDKTITRKLKEIRLAKKLEKKYTKQQILEKYLNTIYFGDGCYGIKSASMHYFSKNPIDLTINESAILASIIKAPSTYSPTKNIDKNYKRKNIVLNKMFEEGYISSAEYQENVKKEVKLNLSSNVVCDYKSLIKRELESVVEKNPYISTTINVYTYCNKTQQENVENYIKLDDINANKSVVILDKNNKIIAYASTCIEQPRQIGSTIKPLAVYAPALDNGTYYLCSKLQDKKININGYSPSNFNDKYYGNVTFLESLSKSLNSCAVQILNNVGIEKGAKCLKTLGFEIEKEDENLSLALGSTLKGQKLTSLTASYGVFRNGEYLTPSTIKEIRTDNNEVLFKDNAKKTKVFNNDTANLIKVALKDTVINGTAKKLNFLPFELCSKTGTVGNENGNTDAYNISFNDDYTIGVWYGNKPNTLLNNNVLGGTHPTELSKIIWENIYMGRNFPKKITIENLKKLEIDSIIYNEENRVIIADDTAPNIYKQTEIFGRHVPKEKSKSFISPKIEMPKYSVNNSVFTMCLCQTKPYYCEIYCIENNDKKIIYDKKPSESYELKFDLKNNTNYTFIIVPYYTYNNNKIYGNEIVVAKIKTPSDLTDGSWWADDI